MLVERVDFVHDPVTIFGRSGKRRAAFHLEHEVAVWVRMVLENPRMTLTAKHVNVLVAERANTRKEALVVQLEVLRPAISISRKELRLVAYCALVVASAYLEHHFLAEVAVEHARAHSVLSNWHWRARRYRIVLHVQLVYASEELYCEPWLRIHATKKEDASGVGDYSDRVARKDDREMANAIFVNAQTSRIHNEKERLVFLKNSLSDKGHLRHVKLLIDLDSVFLLRGKSRAKLMTF